MEIKKEDNAVSTHLGYRVCRLKKNRAATRTDLGIVNSGKISAFAHGSSKRSNGRILAQLTHVRPRVPGVARVEDTEESKLKRKKQSEQREWV